MHAVNRPNLASFHGQVFFFQIGETSPYVRNLLANWSRCSFKESIFFLHRTRALLWQDLSFLQDRVQVEKLFECCVSLPSLGITDELMQYSQKSRTDDGDVDGLRGAAAHVSVIHAWTIQKKKRRERYACVCIYIYIYTHIRASYALRSRDIFNKALPFFSSALSHFLINQQTSPVYH